MGTLGVDVAFRVDIDYVLVLDEPRDLEVRLLFFLEILPEVPDAMVILSFVFFVPWIFRRYATLLREVPCFWMCGPVGGRYSTSR